MSRETVSVGDAVEFDWQAPSGEWLRLSGVIQSGGSGLSIKLSAPIEVSVAGGAWTQTRDSVWVDARERGYRQIFGTI